MGKATEAGAAKLREWLDLSVWKCSCGRMAFAPVGQQEAACDECGEAMQADDCHDIFRAALAACFEAGGFVDAMDRLSSTELVRNTDISEIGQAAEVVAGLEECWSNDWPALCRAAAGLED